MKKNLLFLGLVIGIIALGVLFFVSSGSQVRSEEMFEMLPTREVYTGAWVGGSWDSKTKTLNTAKIKEFENTFRSKMAIVNIFTEWTYIGKPEIVPMLNELGKNGWTPMLSTNPLFFERCPKSESSIYKTIADGACDEFLRSAARNFKTYQKPVLLRFAWEMNLPSMWWSIEKTNSTPQEFIEAWKRIHTIMKEENASNVQMVLSFNTSSPKTVPYAQLYPGDEYVDWVAIDGYNWGTSVEWSKWTTFEGVFKKSYEELTAITGKPMMISEVSTSGAGGDKSVWFEDMLNVQIPHKYKNIKAVVFFSEDKTKNEGVDWRIDADRTNIFTIRNALRNRLYKEQYP